MRKLIFTVLLLGGALPASADDSLLVQACKQATEHYFMQPKLHISQIQDFSNLTPPRVRMRVEETRDVRCEFSANTKPVRLVAYCTVSWACLKAGHRDFDEIAEMLKRDGF